jgi:hypothetical protein
MTGSTFPPSWPHDDPDAVTGYELEPDGTFLPDLDDVAAIPAAAGLWTTAADLVKFGTGWSSLLPGGDPPRPVGGPARDPGRREPSRGLRDLVTHMGPYPAALTDETWTLLHFRIASTARRRWEVLFFSSLVISA